MLTKLFEYIGSKTVSCDVRSLALWRIVTGVAVVYDLVFYKLFYLEKYYFSEALRPESTLVSFFNNGFGLIEKLGTTGFTIFVYLTILLAICFTVGLFDRFVKPFLFVFYSLILFNSLYLLNGFHFLLLVSVFWSIFLPTGAVWSIGKSKEIVIHPLAIYGLYLQIALIYLTSALVKNGIIWIEGSAIELIIQDEYYANNFAFFLRDFPLVARIFTYISLIWEFLIPLFILWPFKKNFKIIAAIMIVLLHIGIAMIVQVGPFLLVGIGFSAALIPGHFWNRIGFLRTKTLESSFFKEEPKLKYRLKTIGLLLLIVLMIKGNLRNWYANSYMSSIMQSIPLSKELFYNRYIPSYFLYGFKDQPWVFFQMEAKDDLGLFVIIEENNNGIFTLNGIELEKNSNGLFKIEPSNFKQGFDHDLKHADFNYMVNLKGSLSVFPETVYKELLLDYNLKLSQEKLNKINKLYLCYLSKKVRFKGELEEFEYNYQINNLSELNLK